MTSGLTCASNSGLWMRPFPEEIADVVVKHAAMPITAQERVNAVPYLAEINGTMIIPHEPKPTHERNVYNYLQKIINYVLYAKENISGKSQTLCEEGAESYGSLVAKTAGLP